MFKNYIKIAWRNLLKQKGFSILNISGLGIGLSCFLLIAIYVIDELSYDKHFQKAERIYRIHSDIIFGGEEQKFPVSSDIIGATLKKDYPEVEEFTRIYTFNGSKLIKKGNEFIEEGFVGHVDSTFFSVFDLPAVAGDLKTALNEPNTVVLSETVALKYFGTTDVVGKSIQTNETGNNLYKINAVIKDIKPNTHFKFHFLFSMDNVEYGWNSHLSHNFYTYLLLKPGTDPVAFKSKLDEYIINYVLPEAKKLMNIPSMEDFKKAGNKLEYNLIPLRDIHLKSDRQFELSAGGNLQYVYIFSAVALFILAIACINFMNLTTARSANRAKEVGIRKVLGTERKQLILQFLSESVLMTVLSLIIALAIAFLVLPLFNDVAAKEMDLESLLSPSILPLIILLPIIVGLLAGSYPAFYLSSFAPIKVLKGSLSSGAKGGKLRSVLVVIQFITSIVLIIGTIVIYKQLDYIQSKNLGYNKDQVLVINNTYTLGTKTDAFKQAILQTTGVKSATYSSFLPVGNSSRNDNSFSRTAVMDSENGFNMQSWVIDEAYIPTMGMKILNGRNFSKEFPTDSSAVIINESAAKFLGYENPIGKKVYTINNISTGDVTEYNIIGVVNNFHFESLKQNIGPLCFRLGRSTGSASFKVAADKIPQIIAAAESSWKKISTEMPFSYRFLDDAFDEMYRSEQRIGKLSLIFSLLAILIACLGLFGLAAYIAEQRTKEIGIRKILGASVSGIVQLLSKDFLKLVLIAFLVAAPLGWWAMNKWLEDFAFRIEINWWIFLLAAFIAIMIAIVTISFQSIRAALANPVKNLRTE